MSCIFGVILIVAPFAGAMALAIWIGAYALAYGAFELVVAVQLFRARRSGEESGGPAWQGPGLLHRERTA
jgi:hypothetical protein